MGYDFMTKSMGRSLTVAMLYYFTTWIAWAGVSRQFELGSGPAEVALNEFAVQTGLQVLFPTELTVGVKTNTVRGYYSVREALDRMLSDTGLSAKYNEDTGVIEISRTPLRNETVVRLPPYTVEGDTKAWRYAKFGNIEVLSACMDDVTRRVIQQIFRLQEALGQIVPPDLLFSSDNPVVYVLHSDADETAVPQELVDRLKGSDSGSKRSMIWKVGVMSSYVFWDMDGQAVYFTLNEGGFMVSRLNIRSDYLRDLMERRTPAMPAWFIEGVLELYSTISLDPYGANDFSMKVKDRNSIPGGVARVAPFVWISPEETLVVRKDRPELLSMGKLFGQPPALGTAAYLQWKAQAALFVRWALHDAKKGREALWKLVRLADTKELSEEDFRACFGQGYDDARADISRYLSKAIRWDFELSPKRFAEMPEYEIRLATELDIAIVKGDLDRLKIGYVNRFAPSLSKRYSDRAKVTIKRAQGLSERSARWASIMGLYECDVDDDLAARSWLEQAVADGTNRPRVYYELARIRFKMMRTTGADGSLPEQTPSEIIALLQNVSRRKPPLPAVYELWGEVLNAGQPTSEQVEDFEKGLIYFPRKTDFIKTVAKLWWKQGQPIRARQTIERGLRMVTNPSDSAELINARSHLSPAE